MGFVNLHCHSEYSLLDGLSRVTDIVDKAKENNQGVSCITDHGVMYSIPKHYEYATSNGIKPIIGFEAYSASDHNNKTDRQMNHFILLAKNIEGYRALSKICSIGHTEGFYYKPRIDNKILEDIGCNNLIASSACLAGIIPQCLLKDDIEKAEKWCIYYTKLFNNDFYLELQPTPIYSQVKVNKGLIELSDKLGIPLVATTDSHYTRFQDKEAHDLLLCMQTNSKWNNPNRWRFEGNTYYLMNEEEIIKAFKQNGHQELNQDKVLEAIHNTVDVAKKCNVEFKYDKNYLPKLKPPTNDTGFNQYLNKTNNTNPTDSDYLKYTALRSLLLLLPDLTNNKEIFIKYYDRLLKELKTIDQMGFSSYFLIVAEYVKWAEENANGVGPGRGCATIDNYVITKDNRKRIDEVVINDEVKGIDNAYHKVINTLQYDCDEQVVKLTTEDDISLQMTKDHKVFAIKKEDYDNGIRTPYWIEIDKLNEDDYLCYNE